MTITTTAKEYGRVFRRVELKRIGKLNEGLILAAQRGAERFVRKALPKDQGGLRRSVQVRIRNRAIPHGRSSVIVEIIVDTPYARAVEFGTRPFIPPIQPLYEWAIRKLHLPPAEAKSAAYAIRATIAEHGLTATFAVRDVQPELVSLLRPHLLAAFEASRR